VLQLLFKKFPTQINRENLSGNRDLFGGIREFDLHSKPPRLIRISGCRRYRLIVARDAARVRLIKNGWS
jgi:hypothetical protein